MDVKLAVMFIVIVLPVFTSSVLYPLYLTITIKESVGLNELGLISESNVIVITVPNNENAIPENVKLFPLTLGDILVAELPLME
jgi:hypothetical protein